MAAAEQVSPIKFRKAMKRLLMACLVIAGCATTRSSHVQPGREKDLVAVQSVVVRQFQCADPAVARFVRGTLIEMILASGVRVVESDGQAVIDGAITMAADRVASGSASSNPDSAHLYVAGTEGAYVSGISTQVLLDGEIVAAASATQVRTDLWIPGPPQVMARKIGAELRKILGR